MLFWWLCCVLSKGECVPFRFGMDMRNKRRCGVLWLTQIVRWCGATIKSDCQASKSRAVRLWLIGVDVECGAI